MKKRNKRSKRLSGCGIMATTTNADWGFIPIPGKGGKTTNFDATKNGSEILAEIRRNIS